MATALESAIAALRDGAPEPALRHLLACWRETHAPPVAEAIHVLSRRLAEANPLSEQRRQRDTVAAWIERVARGEPAELGALLDQLERITAWGHAYLAFPCFDALCAQEADDPRLAACAVAALEHASLGGSAAGKIWTRCGRLLLANPDAECLARCEELIGRAKQTTDPRLGKFLGERLPKLLPKLRARLMGHHAHALETAVAQLAPLVAGLDDGDLVLGERTQPTKAASDTPTSEEAFIARILDEPDDDALRLVFADWLQERGDSRGELIALQYKALEGARVRTRIERLLPEARARWLGPLTRHLRTASVEFDRGLPVAASVELRRKMDARLAAELPQWATFEVLTFLGDWHLLSLQMRALRAVHQLDVAWLPDLLSHPGAARIELLTLRRHYAWTGDLRQHHPCYRELAQTTTLSALRELGLGDAAPGQFAWLWSSPLGTQLHALRASRRPHWSLLQPWLELLAARPVGFELKLGHGATLRHAVDGLEASFVGTLTRYEVNWLDRLAERLGHGATIRVTAAAHDEVRELTASRLRDGRELEGVFEGTWRLPGY